MNEIVNKFFLAGHTFIPEMHVRQPGFIYSVWRPSTKGENKIKKFIYIYISYLSIPGIAAYDRCNVAFSLCLFLGFI